MEAIDVLSDTMGVDFRPYLQLVLKKVKQNWYTRIPGEARTPILKQGKVAIEFAILKDGSTSGLKLAEGGGSGDSAMDNAAWSGISASSPFLPLPSQFAGQFLSLRFRFLYNPDKGNLDAGPTSQLEKSAMTSSPAQIGIPCSSTIIVNVLDQDGRPVNDLPKTGFRIRIDGRPAVLQNAEYEAIPRRMVLIIDLSGSMEGRAGSLAKAAAEEFISSAPSEIPIALVSFSGKGIETVGFDHSRNQTATELNRITEKSGGFKGRSAIYDAIMAAIRALQPVQLGDSIYVITDGGDDSSKVPGSEVREALIKNGVRLFPFLLERHYVEGEKLAGYHAISDLVSDSGGYMFTAEFADNLPEKDEFNGKTGSSLKIQTTFLVNIASGFYTLNVDRKTEAGKASRVVVNVLDDRGKPRRDLRLNFPQSLYATSCASN